MEQKNKGGDWLVKRKVGIIVFDKRLNNMKIVLPNEDVIVKKKFEVSNNILQSSKEEIKEVSFLTDKKESALSQFVICAGIFSMLVLYVINSAAVYCKNEKGIYILLGRAVIWKKNKVFYTRINKNMINKSDSLEYKLLFLKIFFERRKGAEFVITYKNMELYEKIQKRIIVQFIFY